MYALMLAILVVVSLMHPITYSKWELFSFKNFDITRAMEREIAKGSCPLKFVGIEFGDSPYQEIASKERLLEVLSYLYLSDMGKTKVSCP